MEQVRELAKYVMSGLANTQSKADLLSRTFEGDHLITISLEGSERTYQVLKALLVKTSDYFAKALSDNLFVESQTRTLRLPGCDEMKRHLSTFCTTSAIPNYPRSTQEILNYPRSRSR